MDCFVDTCDREALFAVEVQPGRAIEVCSKHLIATMAECDLTYEDVTELPVRAS